MTASDFTLIGLDGGATEAKACAVACDDFTAPDGFSLRGESAARTYEPVEGFSPAPIEIQLAGRAVEIEPTDDERTQGSLWVSAACSSIADVASQCGSSRVLVGVGMPGLKTPDGRGIAVMNNGPRIPDYLAQLERQLADAGIELVSPIAALGSDADYCGLGEQYAGDGLLRDVENAYYVGCGTGIADALKLRGELVPFDRVHSWMLKSWQMNSVLGPTFERLVSAAALNRIFVGLGTRSAESEAVSAREGEAAADAFPEVRAVQNDPLADAWLRTAALVLAELIFERLWTIKDGRPAVDHRGERYMALKPDHEYRGIVLDRVVIGQRLGRVYADPAYRPVFAEHVDSRLAEFLANSGDAALAQAWLDGSRLRSGRLVGSRLRAAAALGAAVAAVMALRVA